MRQFLSLLNRFRSDERGAFLALFGVLAIVLIAVSGAVVDYTSVQQARTRAQVALDAAALALHAKIYEDDYDIEAAAQALLVERVDDPRITIVMDTPIEDEDGGTLTLGARLTVPMYFVALVGVSSLSAEVEATATRGSRDVEVALALDITWSMNSTASGVRKIDALKDATDELIDLVVKDVQVPTYSKMALVPYSNGVNVGSYATAARGPVTSYTAITDAGWLTASSASAFTISAISKANPTQITTSSNHGFVTGDIVNISNVAGSAGFTALNNRSYTITRINNTRFTLDGVSTSGISGSYTGSSGRVTMGSTRIGSAISKQNPGQITTTMNHGLNTGDAVYVTSAAGGGFTALNNREFQVTRISATVFSINQNGSNVSTSGYSGTYTANSAIIRKCQTNECEVVVDSAAHALVDGDPVYITNVSGMTQLNNNVFTVSTELADANRFVLEDTNGYSMSTYTSGGRSYCAIPGCEYYYFENADNDMELWPITNCATERVVANEYTDAPPSTTFVGRNYTGSASLGQCPDLEMLPLTDDKTDLHDLVDDMEPEGSTAGQIGLAWAWYLLSENFTASPAMTALLPAGSVPADSNEDLVKVLILMTDGAFNTGYCNGVTSKNYGVVSDDDSIDCNATNGNPFTQAETMCTNIKKGADGLAGTADDIIVYTVAFDLGSDASAISLMANCATDADHAKTAESSSDLSAAFSEIGNAISALRISE